MIGLGVLGPAAEYRAKSRVVLSVPELLLVKISSAIMVALSLMLVSISIFGLYTLSSHITSYPQTGKCLTSRSIKCRLRVTPGKATDEL